MKRTAAYIALSLAALAAPAQQQLREVTVMSRRPIRDIGIEQTRIDSAALRENIAQSLADVLAYNSAVFVKNYGRATMSTVAFRGTSPAHTRVTWNGLDLSSPMLGMVDFSTIPGQFVDRATLLHGSSGLTEATGGLGGALALSTEPDRDGRTGFTASYIQGVGSFSTFDEYLRLGWTRGRLSLSTRVSYASSPNDFSYRNHDKKENIYDDDHSIIGSYHPREKNRNGAYKDFNVLQEVRYDTGRTGRLGLSAWYASSDRQLPLLTTDYSDDRPYENRRREQTIRAVASWTSFYTNAKLSARGGYVHTWTAYDFRRDPGSGVLTTITRARSGINTFQARATLDFYPSDRWLFTAEVGTRHNTVRSVDGDASTGGPEFATGYDRRRTELNLMASAKWRPSRRVGLSAVLRGDVGSDRSTPPVPAAFADVLLWPAINLLAKASVSSNYRVPSLNDLYYKPGGNPDLANEHGLTYDAGLSAQWGRSGSYTATVSASWFDSRVKDWILWLPTPKGFFSPVNIARVHAYGIEAAAGVQFTPARGWMADVSVNYSWTPSINRGHPRSPADQSVGKQLPYTPLHSASATARLSWRGWSLLYKWNCYSERYTMSSNAPSLTGRLPAYYMNGVTLERQFTLRRVGLSAKLSVNNLFDEEYLSVLARPMPGINFEFFLGITI